MDPMKMIKDDLPEIGKLPQAAIASPSSRLKNSSSVPQSQEETILGVIKEDLGLSDIKLDYSIDKPTGRVVVKVLDGKTGKVLREIPPEEILALAKSMMEMEGLLLNKEV